MHTLYEKLTIMANESNIPNGFSEKHGSLWCTLENKESLLSVAEFLKYLNARVCMITCYTTPTGHELVYHFDIEGTMVNVKLPIADQTVPSITALFKSADWTERELSELYHITIENHPNHQRLFLDESIKESVLNEYFSLSRAMSGQVSQELWKKVRASKGEFHDASK